MPTLLSRARPAAALAAGLLAVGGLAGCTGGGDGAPTSGASRTPASPSSTPLTALDTSSLVVPRTTFCPGVAPAAVSEALDGQEGAGDSYDNGDAARLTDDVHDVAHEFGCTWQAEDGTEARGWVFAPPITVARARALVRAAEHSPGCRPIPDAPDFGKPSTGVTCQQGKRIVAAYHGLFGDAWLSCSVTGKGPRPELVRRAGTWCVTVAQAASD